MSNGGSVDSFPTPSARASDARLRWRRFGEQVPKGEAKALLRIGLAATFTPDPLVPYLGGRLLQAGLPPVIELAPFNQIFQVCFDHRNFFRDPDVIVLLFRWEEIVLEEITAFLNGDAGAFQRASAKISTFASAISHLRQSFPGTIVVNLPPFPTEVSAHALSLENPLALGRLHWSLSGQFVDALAQIPGIRLLDLDAVQRERGLAASFDGRQWYLYHQPFTEAFLLEAGTLLGRLIATTRQAPKKCVVLDCDNTLWGGIIGEDGLSGIQLGDDFPGTAFRDFQRLLLYWRSQGVLLAIASKNNEADVWEVFEKHSGMVLQREHISAWQIGWDAKSEKIPHIARALNIGIDSLVFIDDNPMEIEHMRAARPEVQSVQLPEDPADIMAHLRAQTLFDRLGLTAEDRQRADMMRAEQQRESLGTSLSKDDFRRSLELRLDFFLAQPEDLERITQLINKTNQFNLTTVRRTLDEMRAMAASPGHRIFGLKVADKFGDYGLTGVVLVEISQDRSHWIIDTLLLSCRVLGRGVETALLAALAGEAAAEGAEGLVGSFVPSPKNAPAATFLPDHGFSPKDDQHWRISLSQVPALCPSVTLQSTARSASRQGVRP